MMDTRCGAGTRCGVDHMPGLNFTNFLVPGGNGFPDLYVSPNDPSGWVQQQIGLRQPAAAVPSTKDVATTATVGAVSDVIPEWGKKILDNIAQRLDPREYVKQQLKGLAVGGVLLLVALGFIILGAYQFTKD